MSTRPSIQSTFSNSDQVIIYSGTNQDWRSVSAATFLDWINEEFAAPDPITQRNVPVSGDTVAVTDTGDSYWLLLLPAGTLATLSITLPAVANCVDGQTINVTSSQTITALTINNNGATDVIGEPSTMGATSPFTLKFDKTSLTWYKI